MDGGSVESANGIVKSAECRGEKGLEELSRRKKGGSKGKLGGAEQKEGQVKGNKDVGKKARK